MSVTIRQQGRDPVFQLRQDHRPRGFEVFMDPLGRNGASFGRLRRISSAKKRRQEQEALRRGDGGSARESPSPPFGAAGSRFQSKSQEILYGAFVAMRGGSTTHRL